MDELSTDLRVCAACDSTETYIKKNGVAQWCFHDGFRLCRKCFDRYVWCPYHNPIVHEKWNGLFFKGKRKTVLKTSRKGVCSWCGKKIGDTYIDYYGIIKVIKYTLLHHKKYHDEDVLKDTKESCPSCHMKHHWKIKKNGLLPN